MKWVVVLIIILLASSVSADWNMQYNSTCGNKATELGEDCDPPGKKCYMKDSYAEGTCNFECICKDYIMPVCGNNFLEKDEECEKDDECPMFNYCNANCECVPKIAPELNTTQEQSNETETIETNELIIEADLREVNFSGVNLREADLSLFGKIKRWIKRININIFPGWLKRK